MFASDSLTVVADIGPTGFENASGLEWDVVLARGQADLLADGTRRLREVGAADAGLSLADSGAVKVRVLGTVEFVARYGWTVGVLLVRPRPFRSVIVLNGGSLSTPDQVAAALARLLEAARRTAFARHHAGWALGTAWVVVRATCRLESVGPTVAAWRVARRAQLDCGPAAVEARVLAAMGVTPMMFAEGALPAGLRPDGSLRVGADLREELERRYAQRPFEGWGVRLGRRIHFRTRQIAGRVTDIVAPRRPQSAVAPEQARMSDWLLDEG